MGFYSSHIAKSYPAATMKHIDYIERKNKFKNLTDLLYTESGNLPDWAKDEQDYWQTVTDYELQREEDFKNGKSGKPSYAVRKYNFALPNEMTEKEMITFTEKFLEENFKNYPYTFVIHRKDSAIHGIPNPHVHLIFSDYENNERTKTLDRNTYFKRHGISKSGKEYGGAARNREYADIPPRKYRMTRKDLADRINSWYEERGIDKRVSEKSLKEQMQESADRGDFLTAETLKREKPFRLSPEKFKKYKRVIQEKIKAGWRHVETLDDIPDPDVRNRILQEFEKQIKEEMAESIKKEQTQNQPTVRDKLKAIEYKISEIEMIQKFSPSRESVTGLLNEIHKDRLMKEAERLKLELKGDETANYYLTQKYESEISESFQNEHIRQLTGMDEKTKIKEYAISAYTIREMRKRMNRLIKQREEIMLLKKLSPQRKAEIQKLLKKLDSKESLIKYRKKKGQGYEDLTLEKDTIQKEIKEITENSLSPSEKEEVKKEYQNIQKEIYELREVSSIYANRIKDSGIDQAFRESHKREIQEYMRSLERLNENQISEKETVKEKKSPLHLSRQEVINDTVLRRMEKLKKLLKNEPEKNWKTALEKAMEEKTKGSYMALKKEKESLLYEQKLLPKGEYEKQLSISQEIKTIDKELSSIEKEEGPKWRKEAKALLKEWRKNRTAMVEEMENLKVLLEKDKGRKHLNPKIRKAARSLLKGADETIRGISIRTSASPNEEKRIGLINQKAQEETAGFFKKYQEYAPHTTRYYEEKIIDKKNGGMVTSMKEALWNLEKEKRFKLLADPEMDTKEIDRNIQDIKDGIERFVYQNLTPEIRVKAQEERENSWEHFSVNRKSLVRERDKVRKLRKLKHLELKTEKNLDRVKKYTDRQLSRQKLLSDTVTRRIQDFHKKVLSTIPRKESWYVESVIREMDHGELEKKEKLIRTSMKLIKELKTKYPDQEEKIQKLTEKLKAQMAEKEAYVTSMTTSSVREEAVQRRNEAIKNREANLKALRKEYAGVEKDAGRKHLPPTIRKRNEKIMENLKSILDTSERTHFVKSRSHNTENLMRGAKDMMNGLEDLAGRTIGRANIRTSDEGRD
nr:MobA/MobL family protein [uncultured Dialister sp.]